MLHQQVSKVFSGIFCWHIGSVTLGMIHVESFFFNQDFSRINIILRDCGWLLPSWFCLISSLTPSQPHLPRIKLRAHLTLVIYSLRDKTKPKKLKIEIFFEFSKKFYRD